MKYLIPFLTGALILTAYLFTLPSEVYLEDSGELIAASYNLGIAHPSGYPAYLLLGKLFSFLPFGSIAFRLNLMSAAIGTAAWVITFFAFRALAALFQKSEVGSDLLAAGLILILALSRDFWSQAIVAEVYALHQLFVAIILWLVFSYLARPSMQKVYAIALLSGLGLTNHLLLIFLLPFVWLVVSWQRGVSFSVRQYLAVAGLFLSGLTIYLYLPIRGLTILQSVAHVLRSNYGDLDVSSTGKGALFSSFSQSLVSNLSWFIVGGVILGVWVLLRRRQVKLLLFLMGGGLLTLAGVILLRSYEYSEVIAYINRVYYFQIYLCAIALAFIGFISFGKQLRLLVLLTLFSVGAYQGTQNFFAVNLGNNPVATYYRQLLNSLSEGAVYLTIGEGYDYDSELFTLLYLHKVEGMRPDVAIIDRAGIFFDPGARKAPGPATLAEHRRQYLNYIFEAYPGRPLYTNFPVEAYHSELRSVPTGHSYAITRLEIDQLITPPVPPSLPAIIGHPRTEWDLAFQDFVAAGNYRQAAYWTTAGHPKLAYFNLAAAITYDNQLDSEDYRAFQVFRRVALTK